MDARERRRQSQETVARWRQQLGLSRPQLAAVLGVSSLDEIYQLDGSIGKAVEDRAKWAVRRAATFRKAFLTELQREAAEPLLPDGLLSSGQVAKILKVGDYYVANMRERGKLAAVRTGRVYGYEPKVIESIINADIQIGYHSPLAPQLLKFLDVA